jgi:hypothetical protein
MFLHLGGDVIVPKKDIVAIIDLQSTNQAVASKEFLQLALDEGVVKRITANGKEKSFVLTGDQVYLSPISSTTLLKRSNGREDTFPKSARGI